MKKYIVTTLIATALVACTPMDSSKVNTDVVADIGLINISSTATQTSAATAVNHFNKYCYSGLGSNDIIRQRLERNGYQPIQKKVNAGRVAVVYANKNGEPAVGLSSEPKRPDACMVFMGIDKNAVSLTETLVKQVSNNKFTRTTNIKQTQAQATWVFNPGGVGITVIMVGPPKNIDEIGNVQTIIGARGNIF